MAKRNNQTPPTGVGVVEPAPLHEDTEPMAIESEDRAPIVEVEIETPEVLVVDDEHANLQAVEAALEGLHAKIICCSSGQEALRELLRRNVALILLDVQLPTLDGFETARFIRSRARNRDVPIIFLTAYNQNDEDIRLGYKLGAVDYLFKPFVPEVLRAKVHAFVELRNRTAQVRAQALQLQEMERQAAERRLREARREWEAAALRRKMEEQREINAKLEEADRRKDEFLAILAHELRNPLAPLVAGLELLRMEESCSGTMKRACDAMNRQVGHLVRLVDDLLDVSRISRGKVALRRSRVDVRESITQAVETCRPAADAAGHTLRVALPEQPLHCMADPVRITQMVNNLLGNAVRYTQDGGNIEVEGRVDGDRCVITVRDNGKGIADHMIGRVFEMFVQERTGGHGLGLGLTLVDQVVKLHGGNVQAHSEGPGKGSEFEVRLPLSQEETVTDLAPARERTDQHGSSGGPLRILLVDDHEDIAATTRDLLRAWGHEVHVAHTGQGGVELAARLKPDVALLDIGLPDLDGYGVARRICEELGDDRPHLVAVTGFGQDRDRERTREAGFDGHLVKPARPDQLRDTLDRLEPKASSVNASSA